mmetsp:Transcript_135113/g.200966  ORF Transcript_135113/g.200966 Transcript_135113/m.200966 type:complete len:141 (-) Transcript_135113:39-461(-)
MMKSFTLLSLLGFLYSSTAFSPTSPGAVQGGTGVLFESSTPWSPASGPAVGFQDTSMGPTLQSTTPSMYQSAPLAKAPKKKKKVNENYFGPSQRIMNSGDEAAGLREIIDRQHERGVHCHSHLRDTSRGYNREFITHYLQ